MDTIHLLAALDARYLPQLKVLLTSAAANNPGERFALWLLHSGIPEDDLAAVARWCAQRGHDFAPVRVPDALFEGAPVTRQYPKAMYYRLLAGELLPGAVARALYLDPDILIINPLRPLWETPLHGCVFAAAAHTGMTELANNVNRLRFGAEHDYYNSGVLLIDLARAREAVRPQALFDYVAAHARELVLPDQDLLNALYGPSILPVPDVLWNYDARNYSNYLLRSSGECDVAWVMENTAILHFCGKAKPWKARYLYRFGMLYRHYMQLARRQWPELGGPPTRS